MAQKPVKQPTVAKERLTGYLPLDLVNEIRGILDSLPRSVTLSDIIESALRREVARIHKHGWGPTPLRPRAGRPPK